MECREEKKIMRKMHRKHRGYVVNSIGAVRGTPTSERALPMDW